MAVRNKVVRVTVSGGLIGLFAGSSLASLRNTVKTANASGWYVRQVMPASGANLVQVIGALLILILTLLLWCPMPGYIVVFERVEPDRP